MKKITLLALFILINFFAIGQTLSGADKQTVNISGSNTAVTLDTFLNFYNPLITSSGVFVKPVDFTATIPFSISRLKDGFNTSVDDIEVFRDSFKIVTNNIFYVKKTGSDVADGLTQQTPFLTVNKAIQAGNTTALAYQINVGAGFYDYAEIAFNTVFPTERLNIVGEDETYLFSGENDLSFIKTSEYTYIYEATVSSSLFFTVLDKTEKDKFGAFLELPVYSSLAALAVAEKGYYYDGTKLYVQTRYGSYNADLFMIMYKIQNRIGYSELSTKIYLENVNIYGRQIFENDTIVMRGCDLHYNSESHLFKSTDAKQVILHSSSFSKSNGGDILNYTHCDFVAEINCNSDGYNRNDDVSSQASSVHDTTEIVRINGVYRGQDQSVTDVTGSKTILLGCNLASNYEGNNNTTNTYFTNLQARTGAKIWAWDIKLGGGKWDGAASYELVTDNAAGSVIYIKETDYIKVLAGSVITKW